jgi:phosphate transport system permease protein
MEVNAFCQITRKIKEQLFLCVVRVFTFIAILPLIGVVSYIVFKGFSSLSWSLLFNLPAPVGESGGGMGNAIVGTGLILCFGMILSIPIGVFAGLWLAKNGAKKRAFVVRFCTDVMSGIPSIILGMAVYIVFVLPVHQFSTLAGSAAIALVVIPNITRTTEEMIKRVPMTLIESGLALGIPAWRVTLSIVLRSSWSGIFTGIMLAMSRAVGETAPLLFTSFSNLYWNFSLFNPMSSMTVQIYTYAISPYAEWQNMAWAGALILVTFVLMTTIIVKKFVKRVSYG